jgi:hypothetical protein
MEAVSKSRFAADELYRTVYIYDYENPEEPDWEMLEAKYDKHLVYIYSVLEPVGVYPLNSMMYYLVDRVDMLVVAHTFPRDVTTEDPAIACYDEPPFGECD